MNADASTDPSGISLWVTMSYRDADAALRWLGAVGFTEHLTVRDPGTDTVVHAEWIAPDGCGGIMIGTARPDGITSPPGSGSAYLVVDDPDMVVERAVAAGGRVVVPVADEEASGRRGTVADPEGNLWSVGDYRPS